MGAKKMYYKIENKECEVYKQLRQTRTEEIAIGEANKNAIAEKIGGLHYEEFIGRQGQQNFNRTTTYAGFKFTEPEKVDATVWKPDTNFPEFFVPNRRTKKGREMAEFLLNGLKGNCFDKPLRILGLDYGRRFTFPYVEICGDVIVLYLGDQMEPKDPNVIEITRTEFTELQKVLVS